MRDRCRRQRRASARRSRRVRPCASAARTSRHSPPSASSRSRSSRPSPPARFSNTSADTICRSLQPWRPLTATWRATDCSSPAARHSSKYKGSPARPVSPASPTSLSYWNGKRPCVTLTHLVGDGVDSQISAYLPDQSGPTRHFTSFDAESGPVKSMVFPAFVTITAARDEAVAIRLLGVELPVFPPPRG